MSLGDECEKRNRDQRPENENKVEEPPLKLRRTTQDCKAEERLESSELSPTSLAPFRLTTESAEWFSLNDNQRHLLMRWQLDLGKRSPSSHLSADILNAWSIILEAPAYAIDKYLSSAQHDAFFEGQHRPDDTPRSPSPQATPLQSSLAKLNPSLDSSTIAQIESYILSARRERCRTDGRRRVNQGHLECTFKCGYRTKRAYDWRRHEETHEPQELWACHLCRQDDDQKLFLVNRKDKLQKHARAMHPQCNVDELIRDSQIQLPQNLFDSKCGSCGERFDSWEKRCRHLVTHFEVGTPEGSMYESPKTDGTAAGDKAMERHAS